MTNAKGLLRVRHGHEHARVGFVELFFDLVFVFAITQLSHGLLEHLTPLGALQTGMLTLAVWWAWIYTSWVTNWLEPERAAVRALLFVLMAVGLVMSSAIPEAFGDQGLVFAGAYVAIQLGRTLFMLWASRREGPLWRNFLRIAAWFAVTGTLWVAGGLAEGTARLALWGVALLIDYAAPAASFWTPGLGRTPTTDWNVEGAHLAERCGLFIIIALGESVLIMGQTFAGLEWTASAIAAFATAFVGSVAMWWIYFSAHAELASHQIAESDDPGRIARNAYTYVHVLMVAGIIVSAVGDELSLAHPDGHMEPKTALVLLGGPALYLLGALLFKASIFRTWSPTRLGGLALLGALAPFAMQFTPLGLAAAASGVLVLVAGWETLARARGWFGAAAYVKR